MPIAILGAGAVGSTLARGWLGAGHAIVFGVRDPAKPALAALLAELGPQARALPVAEAAAEALVVVLAVPWSQTMDVLATAGDLAGKIVIDCTNPLTADLTGLVVGHTDSGAEMVARRVPQASVYKSFNQTGANIMAQPVSRGARAVMFVCGDDEDRKPVVMDLATDLGFEAINAGGLVAARLLEPLGLLWIDLARRQGLGRNFAFALDHREGDAARDKRV